MDEIKKDVITTPGTQVPMRTSGSGGIAQGFDGIDKEDMKMPRLAILQQMSALVAEQKGKMGQFANSITKEVYGDSVEIIPLFVFKSRAQFQIGKGLVMLSLDNQTVTFGVGEFEKYAGLPVTEVPGIDWVGKEPPTFNLIYNFPCLIAGERLKEFPVVLSLMRTGTKAAKDFISMARFANEDFFARVYSLKTKIEKNDKGIFAVPNLEFSRRCTNDEYETARIWFNDLFKKKSKIEVDLEEEPLADPKTTAGESNSAQDPDWK